MRARIHACPFLQGLAALEQEIVAAPSTPIHVVQKPASAVPAAASPAAAAPAAESPASDVPQSAFAAPGELKPAAAPKARVIIRKKPAGAGGDGAATAAAAPAAVPVEENPWGAEPAAAAAASASPAAAAKPAARDDDDEDVGFNLSTRKGPPKASLSTSKPKVAALCCQPGLIVCALAACQGSPRCWRRW